MREADVPLDRAADPRYAPGMGERNEAGGERQPGYSAAEQILAGGRGRPGPARRAPAAVSPAMLAGHRRGYYYRAVVYCTTPEIGRPTLSRQRAAEQFWIRELGVTWGTRLDDMRAPLQMIRWVAGAHAPAHHAERERRYIALVALLEGEGSPRERWRAFEALRARMPRVGRAAKRWGETG